MIPKDCFIGFKMGQYCYFQTKISWNKVYLKLRNWFVFLLCSLHLTSVWCIFWMSYPMMSMDWLIENSAHRTTIRRDESPSLPKSNMINKDKKKITPTPGDSLVRQPIHRSVGPVSNKADRSTLSGTILLKQLRKWKIKFYKLIGRMGSPSTLNVKRNMFTSTRLDNEEFY